MSDYHEPSGELTPEDRDLHRALTSFKEEIEAIDWYHQRVSLTKDESLRGVLAHNRDEEIEHACMTLEWLRRRVPAWNRHLSTYLFSSGDITRLESRGGASDESSSRGLGIGALPAEGEHDVSPIGMAPAPASAPNGASPREREATGS